MHRPSYETFENDHSAPSKRQRNDAWPGGAGAYGQQPAGGGMGNAAPSGPSGNSENVASLLSSILTSIGDGGGASFPPNNAAPHSQYMQSGPGAPYPPPSSTQAPYASGAQQASYSQQGAPQGSNYESFASSAGGSHTQDTMSRQPDGWRQTPQYMRDGPPTGRSDNYGSGMGPNSAPMGARGDFHQSNYGRQSPPRGPASQHFDQDRGGQRGGGIGGDPRDAGVRNAPQGHKVHRDRLDPGSKPFRQQDMSGHPSGPGGPGNGFDDRGYDTNRYGGPGRDREGFGQERGPGPRGPHGGGDGHGYYPPENLDGRGYRRGASPPPRRNDDYDMRGPPQRGPPSRESGHSGRGPPPDGWDPRFDGRPEDGRFPPRHGSPPPQRPERGRFDSPARGGAAYPHAPNGGHMPPPSHQSGNRGRYNSPPRDSRGYSPPRRGHSPVPFGRQGDRPGYNDDTRDMYRRSPERHNGPGRNHGAPPPQGMRDREFSFGGPDRGNFGHGSRGNDGSNMPPHREGPPGQGRGGNNSYRGGPPGASYPPDNNRMPRNGGDQGRPIERGMDPGFHAMHDGRPRPRSNAGPEFEADSYGQQRERDLGPYSGGPMSRGPGAEVAPTRELFVGCIKDGTSQQAIADAFGRFGPIQNMKVYPQRHFGFVNFERVHDAVRAKECLDGKGVATSPKLHIEFSREGAVKPPELSANQRNPAGFAPVPGPPAGFAPNKKAGGGGPPPKRAPDPPRRKGGMGYVPAVAANTAEIPPAKGVSVSSTAAAYAVAEKRQPAVPGST